MATAYHRDQAGAPILTYSANQYVAAHFNAFKAILLACLVNGYGSRPAAGWSLINEGSDFIVLRNGSASGYVCFSWVGGLITVYVAETYTGMSGNVMTGDGLKTGTSANNAAPQRVTAVCTAFGTNSTTWSMVADSKSFVLALSAVISTSAAELGWSVNNNAPTTLYVGEDSLGHFIVIGGQNNSTAAATLDLGYFEARGFTALKDPKTGLLVGSSALAVELPGFGLTSDAATHKTTTPLADVELSRAVWAGGGAYAGKLRGIAWTPVLARHKASAAANCLGYVGTMTTRTANTPINLGDGYNYFMNSLMAYTPTFLLTDNPGFW